MVDFGIVCGIHIVGELKANRISIFEKKKMQSYRGEKSRALKRASVIFVLKFLDLPIHFRNLLFVDEFRCVVVFG